ncbi:MAG TPA: hypothetical protein VE077_19985 [Candidatus Methylomirabilis sp.]|nr:hypothetical protein [Candidatus Methylomirabilis sp.]
MLSSFKKPLACIALAAGLAIPCTLSQTSSTGSSSQSAAASASAAPPQAAAAPAQTTDAKKPRKVWTNDDLANVGGQSFPAKKAKDTPGTSSSSGAPDPQYVASAKKQLEKLQGQLRDTEQQLSDLKDFVAGKQPTTSGGYEFNKGYNHVPVDQQITNLQGKKKEIQAKIDDLLDEARKKGVEPGQLR